jgi:cysteinyl-tRNA synthetase
MNAKGLERIKNTVRLLKTTLTKKLVTRDREQTDRSKKFIMDVEQARQKFTDAMDDDFNTALAIASIFDFCKDINIFINREDFIFDTINKEGLQNAWELLGDIDGVLGVLLGIEDESPDDSLTEGLLNLIIDLRQQARTNKDWSMADTIRDRLKEIGVVLEDTPNGVRWKKG